ncbi:MAG: Gfo/Idh/MocA family oxidoreductase [Rhodobacteraceae bacterium]|nr:Gfo/Idh/MocA family oxidoreductase [Paracoccaceae bacterium]
MVGGGQGAFIGAVHRIAARMDGQFILVAGALSSNAERALVSAAELGIDKSRTYASFQQMALAEAAHKEGIEAVVIVTPNHMHFPVAKAFLNAGIHVICDKPLTSNLQDALALEALVETSGKLFVLTHNYTGYPLIRQAQEMVQAGKLGDIRQVHVEYVQDWMAEPVEQDASNKQAIWRADPEKSGKGGCIADIGTHAYDLLRFVTGLKTQSLAADLSINVEGRLLDDNANILLRFEGGAKGILWASQVAVGNENNLVLRVYGAAGGLEWRQENPNQMWFTPLNQPKQLLTRAGAGASVAANRVSRTPGGHPEGYLEGFANLYVEAAELIRHERQGTIGTAPPSLLPTIKDGVEGMRFIEACVISHQNNAAWEALEAN